MKYLKSIIRVNHAGEFGAKYIYKGQIKANKNKDLDMILIHMLEQEKEHFEYFEKIRQINNVSPTIMLPIWKIGGYALGYITAKLGENYMMACTEAVETVIDEHYQNQLPFLDDLPTMKNKIIKFREEELEHKKIAIENHSQDIKFNKIFFRCISNITKIAIKISKKI